MKLVALFLKRFTKPVDHVSLMQREAHVHVHAARAHESIFSQVQSSKVHICKMKFVKDEFNLFLIIQLQIVLIRQFIANS